MPMPKSWVMKLPVGVREQTGWLFIGFMVTLVGLSYLTGVTSSVMKEAIGPNGLRVWGGWLFLTGLLVMWATWKHNAAHEKMALRLLALCMVSYVGWVLTVVPWRDAGMTIGLGFVLIGLAEIRVGFLKVILSYDASASFEFPPEIEADDSDGT